MSLPFSPIRVAGDFAFLSGQVGIKDGELRSERVEEQTAQAIENVLAILKAHDMTLADVVDVTAFLINQDDYGAFNDVYTQYFKEPFPTRAAVTVKSLPLGAKVELKVIAKIKQ